MAERPIIFSAPMVKAILAGRKTQTRRVLKPQPYPLEGRPGFWNASGHVGGRICISDRALLDLHRWPNLGDLLWVRETWKPVHSADPSRGARYRADLDRDQTVWKPSIHMPRWASRITLKVTGVKVERLQDISDKDAKAEGCGLYVPGHGFVTEADLADGYSNYLSPRLGFETIWTSIHGPGSWDANPWVAAISFERVATPDAGEGR